MHLRQMLHNKCVRNELYLFSLTQRRLIVIRFVAFTCVLHVSACTQAILGTSIQGTYKGRYNKNMRGRPRFVSHYFCDVKTKYKT